MWLYYAALQITILVTQRANMQLPASVSIFINTITSIINLSSLNKDVIASTLHIDPAKLTTGGLFDQLDGVALSAILVAIIILALVLCVCLARNVPKV